MNLRNKKAWIESISDTIVGSMINFPLNVTLLYMSRYLDLTVLQTSIFLSVVFTVIAIVRKYMIRNYFSKQK